MKEEQEQRQKQNNLEGGELVDYVRVDFTF
jgi:hypothetical protein